MINERFCIANIAFVNATGLLLSKQSVKTKIYNLGLIILYSKVKV